jgi:hypothetical protein
LLKIKNAILHFYNSFPSELVVYCIFHFSPTCLHPFENCAPRNLHFCMEGVGPAQTCSQCDWASDDPGSEDHNPLLQCQSEVSENFFRRGWPSASVLSRSLCVW